MLTPVAQRAFDPLIVATCHTDIGVIEMDFGVNAILGSQFAADMTATVGLAVVDDVEAITHTALPRQALEETRQHIIAVE